MIKFNPENERVKRRYLEWEKEANGKSTSTVINIQNYIYEFEKFTNFKSFKEYNKADAIAFKKHIGQKQNTRLKSVISKSYLLHALKSLNSFFKWLAEKPGYKSKIDLSQVAYLSLSEKDIQIARASKTKRFPTLEQIEHVIRKMPAETEVQKRNRALIAFLILTGGRVMAVASLKLKHVFLDDQRIEQHPSEVKTKHSKKIVTYFFPIGDHLKNIFIEWVLFLKTKKLFDGNAPLFPNTKLSLNENDKFHRQELEAVPWKSTTGIRTILKEAFEAAGLEYYNPHSFRNTVVQLGYQRCRTPEDFKAWSQNLGHASPLTTFVSYGYIEENNQGKIIKGLTKDIGAMPDNMKELARAILDEVQKK